MLKKSVLLSLLLFLSLSAIAHAAENGIGVIEGQLVNGTANGSSVASQSITLKVYLNGAETDPLTSVTDDKGGFNFSGLVTGQEYSYQVSLFFQDAEYTGNTFSFSENETVKSEKIIVYDSTDNADSISVNLAHTIIYVGQDILQVTEYYLLQNDSDLTYIGSREINEEGTKETLVFPLPGDIDQLHPGLDLMDCCIYRTDEGFIDTMAFIPGTKEISFTYTLDTKSSEYSFPHRIKYPVADYALLVQGTGVQTDVDKLTSLGIMDEGGEQYTHFSGQNLAPDSTHTIKLAGLPQSSGKNAVFWVILALAMLGGGVGIGYSRRAKTQPIKSDDMSVVSQQELLLKLARLDDGFENGVISKGIYRRERDLILSQLMAQVNKTDPQ